MELRIVHRTIGPFGPLGGNVFFSLSIQGKLISVCLFYPTVCRKRRVIENRCSAI